MDVRIGERPRCDQLISVLITERDGAGQNDAWCIVCPALGVWLLALLQSSAPASNEMMMVSEDPVATF